MLGIHLAQGRGNGGGGGGGVSLVLFIHSISLFRIYYKLTQTTKIVNAPVWAIVKSKKRAFSEVMVNWRNSFLHQVLPLSLLF